MMMTKFLQYQCDHTNYKGFFASESSHSEKKPTILIFPTWFGLNAFAEVQAARIATYGYHCLAVDLYGEGKIPSSPTEAASLMAPLVQDRDELRKRLLAAYGLANSLPGSNPENIGTIGFCFGGLCTFELLKSGVPLKAGISVHGAFPEGDNKTEWARNIKSSFLILSGAQDPIATLSDLSRVQNELTQASVDWQTHLFGSAGHSFTNKDAADRAGGYYYDPLAAERSYILIQQFFKEKFT